MRNPQGGAGGAGAPSEAPKAEAKKSRADGRRIDDGRKAMYKIFVESRSSARAILNCAGAAGVDGRRRRTWSSRSSRRLHDKGIVPVEKSLKLMSDKSRTAYLPLEKYDVDIELTRGFPAEVCRRWCVLPFDRMSKAILVATANPFNQQAVKELSEATSHRLVWYLVPPADLLREHPQSFPLKPWPR